MKKVCLALCVIALLFTFCGCAANGGTDTSTAPSLSDMQAVDSNIIIFPTDVTKVADFKCICSVNDGENFDIRDEVAKKLYAVITEAYKQADKIKLPVCEGNSLYLSFQAGGGNQNNLSDYYGCFFLYENDYMGFTGAPMISYAEDFLAPEGTYDRVLEMIENK